jgi:hypothetical protein
VNDLLGELYRRRWWIGAVLVLAALTGGVLGARSPLESRSDVRLLLTDTTEETALTSALQTLPIEERQTAVTSRVESQLTRDRVVEALDLAPDAIRGISADAGEGSSLIAVHVTTVSGVDASEVADWVAREVVEQQGAAARERLDALGRQLRDAGASMQEEIAALEAALQALVREIAVLQLEVDASEGTGDPHAAIELALKSDEAAGMRSTRSALHETQADFERRAREAEVAAAVRTGGLEVYGSASDVATSRSLPPKQLGILAASLAFVVMVGIAYFATYRAEAQMLPLVLVTDPALGRTAPPGGRRRADDLPADDHSFVSQAEPT